MIISLAVRLHGQAYLCIVIRALPAKRRGTFYIHALLSLRTDLSDVFCRKGLSLADTCSVGCFLDIKGVLDHGDVFGLQGILDNVDGVL